MPARRRRGRAAAAGSRRQRDGHSSNAPRPPRPPAPPRAGARTHRRSSLTVLAWLLHVARRRAARLRAGHVPWSNMYEFSLTGTLIIVGVFLVVQFWQRPALPRRLHHRLRRCSCSASRRSTSTSTSCRCRRRCSRTGSSSTCSSPRSAPALFALGAGLSIAQLLQARRESRASSDRLQASSRRCRCASGSRPSPTASIIVGFIFWTFTLIAGSIWAETRVGPLLGLGHQGSLDLHHLGALRRLHPRAGDPRLARHRAPPGSRSSASPPCCSTSRS